MRLQRLTGLERDKIVAEQQELQALTEELRAILASETRLMEVIKEELMDVRNRFADERRTRIQDAVEDISILDLIEDEEQVITMSVRGYIKRMSNDEFKNNVVVVKVNEVSKQKKKMQRKISSWPIPEETCSFSQPKESCTNFLSTKSLKHQGTHRELRSLIYCRLIKTTRLLPY